MKFDNTKTYSITKIKESNPGRIELNYWVVGTIPLEPEKGFGVFMWRTANKENPGGKYGYFRTSKVVDIIKNEDNWEIQTLNSTYRLEENKISKE
jgi:hypothetical protein